MSISAADVKKLRDMTGAGMMDCKKALAEAEGDFDSAVEILRKKGQKVADKLPTVLFKAFENHEIREHRCRLCVSSRAL